MKFSTEEHKNIIVKTFHQKQDVITMYEALLQRQYTKHNSIALTNDTLQKIDKVKDQMNMLLDKFPEYFI